MHLNSSYEFINEPYANPHLQHVISIYIDELLLWRIGLVIHIIRWLLYESYEPYANPDYIRLNPYIARNLALYGGCIPQINFSWFCVITCCRCNSSQSPVASWTANSPTNRRRTWDCTTKPEPQWHRNWNALPHHGYRRPQGSGHRTHNSAVPNNHLNWMPHGTDRLGLLVRWLTVEYSYCSTNHEAADEWLRPHWFSRYWLFGERKYLWQFLLDLRPYTITEIFLLLQ